MKRLALIALALVMSLSANQAPAEELCDDEKVIVKETFEKEGFLSTTECAAAGEFTDCYLENYACGSSGCFLETEPGVKKDVDMVLFSHNDGVTYKLDTSAVKASEFDQGINRNAVTVVGELDASTNTIAVHEFKAPPPPKKSFFKGCL